MRKKRDFYSEFHFHFGLRRRVVLLMIKLCLFIVMIESEALEASVDELLKEMAGTEQQTVSFFFLLLLLLLVIMS